MAIVCPKCGTENRSIAKFCIECIAPLPASRGDAPKPPTEPAPLPDDMPSALAAFVSPGPPSPLMPPVHLPPLPRSPAAGPGRQGVGIGVVFLCLLASAALAWLLLGGNPWRAEEAHASATQAEPAAEGQRREVSGDIEPVVSPAPQQATLIAEPAPTPAETLAPGEAIVAAREHPSPRPPPPAPAPAPATPVTVAVAAAPKTAAPAPPARPEHATPLFARCDGLGYIAASRCRVDLCDQSTNRQRKECEPVLAQQRVIEEKRNPTMAN